MLTLRNRPEAARLLWTQRDMVQSGAQPLETACAPFAPGVNLLMQEYQKSDDAKKHRQAAVTLRRGARQQRATLLQQGPAAFDTLVAAPQRGSARVAYMNSLTQLGDHVVRSDQVEAAPRKPPCRLPRSAASNSASPRQRIGCCACWRRISTTHGLQRPADRQRFDQHRRPRLTTDKTWEQKQHPRHDAIARVMEVCLAIGAAINLSRCIPGARWARGRQFEPVLIQVAGLGDDRLASRRSALGWRLRSAAAAPIACGAQHKDARTQFLRRGSAAAGLTAYGAAVVGRVLDIDAAAGCCALGELGDLQRLDLLLKYANDPTQPIQQDAAEAPGTGTVAPGRGNLQAAGYARGNDGRRSARRGLHWLDTTAGWQLIESGSPTSTPLPPRDDRLPASTASGDGDLLLKLLADTKTRSRPERLSRREAVASGESLVGLRGCSEPSTGPGERDALPRTHHRARQAATSRC
jgi:hypothetical protein